MIDLVVSTYIITEGIRKMKKSLIIYEEETQLYARFDHPKCREGLSYQAKMRIMDTGKLPVELTLTFNGIYPYGAPMPPEEHEIKATLIMDLYSKVLRWFRKYGYEVT
ncbi:MAG: hypothetical protein FJ264_17915 [Planctomycetes bacterium]|nr:hypothetical protein [Planctomycetota bacterium]MBM4066170.1 hypothetical protein [Planctomycetota bacterium]